MGESRCCFGKGEVGLGLLSERMASTAERELTVSILTCTRLYAKNLKESVTDPMNGAVNSRHHRLPRAPTPWPLCVLNKPTKRSKDVAPFQGWRGVGGRPSAGNGTMKAGCRLGPEFAVLERLYTYFGV